MTSSFIGISPETCLLACGRTEQSAQSRGQLLLTPPFPGGFVWARVTPWSGLQDGLEFYRSSLGSSGLELPYVLVSKWGRCGSNSRGRERSRRVCSGWPSHLSTHTRIRPREARCPACLGVRRNSTGGRLRVWRCPKRPALRISGGEL